MILQVARAVKDASLMLIWWYFVTLYTLGNLIIDTGRQLLTLMKNKIVSPVAKTIMHKRLQLQQKAIQMRKNNQIIKKCAAVLESSRAHIVPMSYEWLADRYDQLITHWEQLATFSYYKGNTNKGRLSIMRFVPVNMKPYQIMRETGSKVKTAGLLVVDLALLWLYGVVFMCVLIVFAPVGGSTKLQEYRRYRTLFQQTKKAINDIK
jgi:hypothetical protein